jgi:hypothetical protein
LFRDKCIVRLNLQKGKFICTFDPKKAKDREHHFYWKVVNQDMHFGSDPLFTLPNIIDDASDIGHRDWSNYTDHIARFPNFKEVKKEVLQNRVERISQMSLSTPPIPRISRFPDTESVQVIAYQRFIRFRQFVDEIVGSSNRFWKVNRTPSWAREVMDFQLMEQDSLSSLSSRR